MPSIFVIEIVYLIDKGRIPTIVAERVRQVLRDPSSGFQVATLHLSVADRTGQIPRAVVPDLPDRVIAVTALALGLPLITRDGKIRTSGIQTVWPERGPERVSLIRRLREFSESSSRPLRAPS